MVQSWTKEREEVERAEKKNLNRIIILKKIKENTFDL